MHATESESPGPTASPLEIVKRILEIDGESVVNLIRILALLAFYGIHATATSKTNAHS